MSDFQYWCTRSRVRRFIRETFEETEEYGINLGPTQDQVAAEFFGNDSRQALAVLDDLVRLGQAQRVLSYGLRWIPAEAPLKTRASPTTYVRTEVTERVLVYVTREFNEGKAGNRDSLPSTRDIAQACVRGYGKAKSCRRAQVHLNRLMWSGEIIKVQDPEDERWHRTFWALNEPGRFAGGVVTDERR